MLAAFDVFITLLKTFLSCLIERQKRPKRSWRGEFLCRLAKNMLARSIGKPFNWIRARQNILTLYSPDLLKVKVEETQISGVPCLTLEAKNNTSQDKVIVYFHGGGYAVGSAHGYKLMGAKLSLMCKAKVVLVDYRLIPEHALPAAQEDCYAVTKEVLNQAKQEQVILMGDSAGGALCLSTIQRLQSASTSSEDLSKLIASVLISPWVAPLSIEHLSLENEASDMLDRYITQYWADTFYLPSVQRTDIDFSEAEHLRFLTEYCPKLYIQLAGAEVFLKQIQDFSQHLTSLGLEHQVDLFEDQFHVFQTFSPLVPEAKKALEKIAEFVRSR